MKIAFTLCSNNYLAQAKALSDSVNEHHPEYKFYIGIVDELSSDINYKEFTNAEILSFKDLNYAIFDDMIERYNIVEFNTAVKPFYFDYFFNRINVGDSVLYIDPDILLHQRMEEVENKLESYDFILTPHLLEPLHEQSQFEKLILNVGVFNLGFLALKVSATTKIFLDWWKSRLRYDCRIAFDEGLFVDQIWINYVPCLFDNVYILKQPGYNMGYWNFNERTISIKDKIYFVNEDYELSLFHYSSFNPMNPDKLCKWLEYSFETRPDLKSLYENYARILMNNKYEFYSKFHRGLNFKENHPFADNKQLILTRRQKIGRKVNKIVSKIVCNIFNI